MDHYLPFSIASQIYYYIGWGSLKDDDSVPDYVWRYICDIFCKDCTWKAGFIAYNAYDDLHFSHKDAFLYYMNFLLNQSCTNIPTFLWTNKDFVLNYVGSGVIELSLIAPHLRCDPDVILSGLPLNPDFFDCTTVAFRSDFQLMIKAIKRNFNIFNIAHKSLLSDHNFIVEAINANSSILNEISNGWLNNPDVMLRAVVQNPCIIIHVNTDLCHNKAWILRVIKQNPKVLDYISLFDINKQILIEAVKYFGPSVLHRVDPTWRSNGNLILELLKIPTNFFRREDILTYIHPLLKKDPIFMAKACRIRNFHHFYPLAIKKIYTNNEFGKQYEDYKVQSWLLK